jgi:hypothetical protein
MSLGSERGSGTVEKQRIPRKPKKTDKKIDKAAEKKQELIKKRKKA